MQTEASNAETKQIEMIPVESSQIHAISHDPESNTLAIRFKRWNGEISSLYHYQNFTAEDFERFRSAESLGKHFGAHIKPATTVHPFTKVEPSPSTQPAEVTP